MIRSVEMEGFRGIRQGKLVGLTQLVVLVGPNGSGKSTVLDAMLLGAGPRLAEALGQVLNRRHVRGKGRWLLCQDVAYGRITASADEQFVPARTVSLSRDEATPADRAYVKIRATTEVPPRSGGGAVNLIVTADGEIQGSGTGPGPLLGTGDVGLVELDADVPIHRLFSRAAEQGRRREVRSLIAEVVPGVSDIEILTEGDTPVIYLVFEGYSIPSALAGDGIRSLLRLSLELASRPDGVVLLEEPEVHEHPGALRQSARAIHAAVRRGIQVILTTHSLELLDALLSEASDASALDRLSVYRLQLVDGRLASSRVAGPDVAFARNEIGDDLR